MSSFKAWTSFAYKLTTNALICFSCLWSTSIWRDKLQKMTTGTKLTRRRKGFEIPWKRCLKLLHTQACQWTHSKGSNKLVIIQSHQAKETTKPIKMSGNGRLSVDWSRITSFRPSIGNEIRTYKSPVRIRPNLCSTSAGSSYYRRKFVLLNTGFFKNKKIIVLTIVYAINIVAKAPAAPTLLQTENFSAIGV